MKQEVSNKITYYNFFMALVIVLFHWHDQFFDLSNFLVEQPVDVNIMDRLMNFSQNLAGPALSYYFVLSGLLFYRNISEKTLWKKIKKSIYSLGAPMIIWNLALELYSRVIYGRWGWEDGRNIESVKDILLGFTFRPFNIVTWYFFALLLYLLISPLILLVGKNKIVMTFFTVGINILVVSLVFYGVTLSNTIVYFPMYLIGAYLGLYYQDIILNERYDANIFSFASLVATVVCLMVMWNFDGVTSLVAQRILGVSAWLNVKSSFFERKPGKVITCSFYLYVLHESWLISIAKSIIVNRLMNYSYNLLGHILLAVGSIAFVYFLCIACTVFMKLVLNEWLFKAMSGGRVWVQSHG